MRERFIVVLEGVQDGVDMMSIVVSSTVPVPNGFLDLECQAVASPTQVAILFDRIVPSWHICTIHTSQVFDRDCP